jgi:hypothetical protein
MHRSRVVTRRSSPRRRLRRPHPVLGLFPGLILMTSLAAVGCTSPADRRAAIEEIDISWITEMPEGSLADMTEQIRELGKLKPASSEALISLPLLTRQAFQSESAWIRTEALRAAWKLAGPIPVEPLLVTDVPAAEFNEWMHRFEQLDADQELQQGEEIQELALSIASYRFSPSQTRYAIELAAVTTVRGIQRRDSPVQAVFAGQAPEACRHALSLVTLLAGDDKIDYVREEALRAARHLDPETALRRLAATLTSETDSAVLLALLDSMEDLAQRFGIAPVAELLDYAARSSDAAVRRRAQTIVEEFQA